MLPINSKNVCALQERGLAQLQEKLKSKNFIIHNEFSVIGQIILGWTD